ncbi:hypothetical protein [Deinococcus peraridilitoris]|uniref:Uncharacterized protein n=1 Tax=Deinococcus peraridilitoris (strain DSM 19664 / LMG 22246 / CIP 109416 / KR-200) TaxID=937777 RepID=K9ZXZ3_DEIPD|nr:hypothetical protein [Deinococcus peraridilitoris]AFZ66064.1 hypothetical protein Deipe_0468 [Deinococcus peraridilitoris DSM 19664]
MKKTTAQSAVTGLSAALGRQRDTLTLLNWKGEELNVIVAKASLNELVDFQERMGGLTGEVSKEQALELQTLLVNVLADRTVGVTREHVQEWARFLEVDEMTTVLTTIVTGQVPDPNAHRPQLNPTGV